MPDRSEINFQNAQKSTGPKTPEGKAAVAQNRIAHCLAGVRLLLPGESNEMLNLLRRALFDEHVPQTPTEVFLVEQIVHNQYRLTRIAEMETTILAELAGLGVDEPTPATLAALEMVRRLNDPVKALALVQRYEASCRRAYNQALTQLRVMQNKRMRDTREREKFFEQAKARAKDEYYDAAALKPDRPAPESVENQPCDSNPTDPAASSLNGPNGVDPKVA
jgi:hypothetical protein